MRVSWLLLSPLLLARPVSAEPAVSAANLMTAEGASLGRVEVTASCCAVDVKFRAADDHKVVAYTVKVACTPDALGITGTARAVTLNPDPQAQITTALDFRVDHCRFDGGQGHLAVAVSGTMIDASGGRTAFTAERDDKSPLLTPLTPVCAGEDLPACPVKEGALPWLR
ncbi:MAG: hypothetical protein H6739_32150 [Alphaproteobacteria bacterium]|nr:hypothetical protein [Alphaproteobacteria bacterium]